MNSPLDTASDRIKIDRISASQRPDERPIGYQVWTNLLFVHWRIPAELVAPLLPKSLTLDTRDGDAFVGLVPFYMSGVRPWWSPAIPGISTFCETNVRTYVHHEGRDPGVWFFSLEAAKSLAVRIARWRWYLPYFRARMSLRRKGDRVSYDSHRLWPEPRGAGMTAEINVGPLLGHDVANRESPPGRAIPGTLEHFLVERYILFAADQHGNLMRGQVHHIPYPVRTAKVVSLTETLLPALGITPDSDPCHVAFSDGVRVEVFPLRRVEC
ncbi:MAG: DUF2071 domain-containing protein [Planctomycetales bacterium]|nr:DUF2071 domain-containing protein [Planctomycetales bacterium]